MPIESASDKTEADSVPPDAWAARAESNAGKLESNATEIESNVIGTPLKIYQLTRRGGNKTAFSEAF